MQLGLTSFAQMKKDVPISRDPKANEMVQRVGRRIAAVANLPGAQWEFIVFDSQEANAFCLPGGKVGVYTGILPICRDEAGLATVLGHEVAHAVARHGGARMTEAVGLQLGGEVASAWVDQSKYAKYSPVVNNAWGLGTQLGVALPHSRVQESEADEIGLLYMARAGYPPAAAVEFWKRFSEFNRRQGGDTPWFLRTHPTDDQRIAHLRALQPKAESQFKAQ
jgi:predicted Zn-dependent protease